MTPEFDELVEGVESAEERARLRRVHELLQEAGPPPELSPVLASITPPEEEPADEADVAWLPPRRLGAALVLAATLLLASFAVGYFAGNNRSSGGTEAIKVTRTIALHGEGTSTGVVSVGQADADGNIPMLITVRGLAPLPEGDYYSLTLTKGGKPVVTCTTFNVGDRGTNTIDLVAAYDLSGFDGWAVTQWHAKKHDETRVLWTTA
ncbi:MAG TPA: hypothetical protein VIZ29_06750 [Gaiellaceae bacterium]